MMTGEIIVSIISAVFSGACALGGILISNGKTVFRLEQLEKKVEKHNNLIERMVAVEQSAKSAHHRLDDIERGK
jgi:hypothetical protein